MTKDRVVFLGTAAFAVPTLDALVSVGAPPVAVYTQPDRPAGRGRNPRPSPIKQHALELGLPVVQPETLRTPEAEAELRRLEPTVLVLAAYGLILPTTFLEVAPHGGLNVHPSLLPRYRGPAPVVWTILEGDEEAGVTIFRMDRGMDSGPIVNQRRIRLVGDETAGELTDRLAHEGAVLLVETLQPWLREEIVPTPQAEADATYSRLLSKSDGELDFTRPVDELERRVRALNPWPGTFTRLGGRRLSILRARAHEDRDSDLRPGEVAKAASGSGFEIGAAQGTLDVQEVQLEGKRAVSAEEFARGRRDMLGSVLPS